MKDVSISVLKKIEENNFKAYIVGGYPRNEYLNIESSDVDICTSATPKDLKEIFTDIKLPKEQYGSVVLFKNNIRFEITTFRKDIKYKDKRHPIKIKYIDSLIDDLKRRDFTINTLCIDSNDEFIDLLGAKEDIDLKIIKAVGNPKTKIKEDSLRILRAIRFATTLNFNLDKDLKTYIKRYASSLKKLSYDRKQEELDKIFSSPNVMTGINLIERLKLDKYLDLQNIKNVKKTSFSIGIWAQLGELKNYKFSNHEKQIISAIKELINKDIMDNNNLYKYGPFVSTIAAEISGIDRKEVTKKYDELYIKNISEINLTTNEICEILNKKPGPFLKEVKNLLEEALVNKKVSNEKEALISYLKKYI